MNENRQTSKSLRLLWEMTKHELRSRYTGSYLGIVWAVALPAMTVMVLWFVFSVGFKAAAVGEAPFILWLLCGMTPWFFVSEAISGATNSITGNGYLVKKVSFQLDLLPLVKILAAFNVHLFFIGILLLFFCGYGWPFHWSWVQLCYYMFASFVLVCGIGWWIASLAVFLPDLGQAIAVILQFLFWLTPIFWPITIVPVQYHFWLQLNPMYYLVEGYRNSLIDHRWFWETPLQAVFFWSIAILLFLSGRVVFRKLKPHFADLL